MLRSQLQLLSRKDVGDDEETLVLYVPVKASSISGTGPSAGEIPLDFDSNVGYTGEIIVDMNADPVNFRCVVAGTYTVSWRGCVTSASPPGIEFTPVLVDKDGLTEGRTTAIATAGSKTTSMGVTKEYDVGDTFRFAYYNSGVATTLGSDLSCSTTDPTKTAGVIITK